MSADPSEPDEPRRSLSPAQRRRLPMFPLPGAVLFPDALMPLHVFEPRYVALVEHAMAHLDGAIAIATLRPGHEAEYTGRPPVYPVMGAGVIIASDDRPDGRYDIVVRGLERVRVRRELPPTEPFREVAVTTLVDEPAVKHPLEHRLRDLLMQLAERAPAAREALHLIVSQAESAGELTNLVGMHALSDPTLKRLLLENVDVAGRLSLACDAMGRLLLEVHSAPAGTLH